MLPRKQQITLKEQGQDVMPWGSHACQHTACYCCHLYDLPLLPLLLLPLVTLLKGLLQQQGCQSRHL
jgi:hypothetical protein